METLPGHHMAAVRELAEQWSLADLETCEAEVIGNNVCRCVPGQPPDVALSLLAKAAYIRRLLDGGHVGIREALRILGRQMRRLGT